MAHMVTYPCITLGLKGLGSDRGLGIRPLISGLGFTFLGSGG